MRRLAFSTRPVDLVAVKGKTEPTKASRSVPLAPRRGDRGSTTRPGHRVLRRRSAKSWATCLGSRTSRRRNLGANLGGLQSSDGN
eukprot:Skav207306  [mRNA]  locus=scaffold533:225317:225571:+ [translate_table: standard]